MFYENEFELVCAAFRKSGVLVTSMSPVEPIVSLVDADLKPLFSKFFPSDISVDALLGGVKPQKLYKFKDNLELSYLALLLPSSEGKTIVIIGPFLREHLSEEQILELCEKAGISPKNKAAINEFFASLPIFTEGNPLSLLLDAFCERMWNGPYEIAEVFRDIPPVEQDSLVTFEANGLDDTFLNMKNMERRYTFENEIMNAVTLGSEHKLNQIFSSFNDAFFEKRVSDPLRNAKNYCIIMNTLLRKAAERGGVHPMYLDKMSSSFALQIEQFSSLGKIKSFMTDIFVSYCRLVKGHSAKGYSPIVKSAVIAIDADPSAELNLHSLAQKLNVSNVYLSTIFRRETGKTVTEYIKDKRISLAKHLLKTTSLQIQTVSLHCGMTDVHYFSKLFKQMTGKTPSEYRKSGG